MATLQQKCVSSIFIYSRFVTMHVCVLRDSMQLCANSLFFKLRITAHNCAWLRKAIYPVRAWARMYARIYAPKWVLLGGRYCSTFPFWRKSQAKRICFYTIYRPTLSTYTWMWSHPIKFNGYLNFLKFSHESILNHISIWCWSIHIIQHTLFSWSFSSTFISYIYACYVVSVLHALISYHFQAKLIIIQIHILANVLH